MIIVPTRVCNTDNCNYCWVYKKDFHEKYFNSFDIEDFYEKIKILASKSNDYELRFFWWEPMIRFDIIKKIVNYIKEKDSKFKFTINTNLTLLDEEKIDFVKKNNIKLIISCNWKLKNHSETRWISIKETIELYKNIKKITSNNIKNQINIVVNNENSKELVENLEFIEKYLWWKNINLLPVNYNWWNEKWLKEFEISLNNLENKIKNKETNIIFINKEINNKVPLFNNEFVIDSDWKVYPNMVILEGFFNYEKEKILITNISKNIEIFKSDVNFFDNENNILFNNFINNFLKKTFTNIIENDFKSSEIFHNFLMKI